MDDLMSVRLRCLEMAVGLVGRLDDDIELASRMYNFVVGGAVSEPFLHQFGEECAQSYQDGITAAVDLVQGLVDQDDNDTDKDDDWEKGWNSSLHEVLDRLKMDLLDRHEVEMEEPTQPTAAGLRASVRHAWRGDGCRHRYQG